MKWQIRFDETLLARIVLIGLVVISLLHFTAFFVDEARHAFQRIKGNQEVVAVVENLI